MSFHVALSPTRSCPISWWSDTSTVGRGIETVETVSMSPAPDGTPLKRGVNESSQSQELAGQIRNPKVEARTALGLRFRTSDFGIRPSFGLRSSDFGLQSYSRPDLINTPLQRGVVRARWQETVLTVSWLAWPERTTS